MKIAKQMVLSLLLLLFLCVCANAAEDLTDWSEYVEQGTVTFNTTGTMTTISASSASGEVTYGHISKYFQDAAGVIATINISAITGWGDLRIRQYVGALPSGNLVLAELYVAESSNGERRIQYRVRERMEDNTNVAQLASGALGDWSGMWQTGEDLTIGIGMVGEDICFYTSKLDTITKVRVGKSLTPTQRSIMIATADEYGGSITGVVKDVTILYEGNMGVFSDVSAKGISISGDQTVNSPIKVTVNPFNSDGTERYYKFYYAPHYGTSDYGTEWIVVQDYSTVNTADYTFVVPGDYVIVVRVVDDPNNEPVALPIMGGVLHIE